MVGRDEEIAELKAIAEGDRSCLVVVYGRRRIGKTFLVREAFNCSRLPGAVVMDRCVCPSQEVPVQK